MKAQLLEGKNVLLTGGSTGIGKETARLFVEEGANVLITARTEANLQATTDWIKSFDYPGKIEYIVADGRIEENVNAAYQKLLDDYGPCDVLVNNAGVASRNSIECVDNEEWETIMATNVTAIFYYVRLILPQMLEQKSGSIINVSSVAGTRNISGFAYTSSKSAVTGMSRNIAFRGLDDHVRCNCVCPGHVEGTNMVEAVKAMLKDPNLTPMSRFTDRFLNRGREFDAQPIDLANMMLFLASDLSEHVTGQIITVDPGTFL